MIRFFKKYKKYASYVVLVSLAGLLAGCSFTRLPDVPDNQITTLQGHGFYLRSVTVAPGAAQRMGGGSVPMENHCLPDAVYAKLLQNQLETAFAHAKLRSGRNAPIPVDVSLTSFEFTRRAMIFTHGSHLITALSAGGVHINKIPIVNNYGPGYRDSSIPLYQRGSYLFSTMALMITNGLDALKHGRNFNDAEHWGYGIFVNPYWSNTLLNGYHNTIPKNGLHTPLTTADYERILGKPSAELAAMCQARIAAAQ